MSTDSLIIRRRLRQLLILAAALFAGLTARLWYLQIVRGELYRSLADANRLRKVSDAAAPRGILYDRNGHILATNEPRHSVALIPDAYREHPETAARLSVLLGKPAVEIDELVRTRGRLPYLPVNIARGVDRDTIYRVEENLCRLPGALVRSDPIRFYPAGSLAAHVLGHVGEISERELKEVGHDPRFVPGTVIGKTGVEKAYDWYLMGRQGEEKLEVDARGQVRQRLGEKRSSPGASLVLTLDRSLQRLSESLLEGTGLPGAVIVMDVRTGELLALASKPDFDPNVFSVGMTKAEWTRLNNHPRDPLQSRAISSRYPAGSTFKLVTAAAGLACGAVPAGRVRCTGSIQIGDRKFPCWKAHGAVNLEEALAESCNAYFYQVGMRVGISRLERVMRQFGLGRLTGIDLPNEKPGIAPSRSWKRRTLRERWYWGDTANLSIGQGHLLATPLQMARVTAAVANGGKLVTPHVVRKVISVDGKLLKVITSETRPLGIDPRHLARIRKGMRLAVAGRHGTAQGLGDLPVKVAAKTGSAETYGDKEPHSWLVTFGPYEAPKIAMAVIVEHGGHGSDTALPIARALYRRLWSGDDRILIASAR